MSTDDAPSPRSAQQNGERDVARREPGETPAVAAPAAERTSAPSGATEKELLCTICGLRACWT